MRDCGKYIGVGVKEFDGLDYLAFCMRTVLKIDSKEKTHKYNNIIDYK